MERFTGKTVIVTGSSSGIGEGIARRFSAEGANVVLNSRSRDDLAEVAADLDPERTFVVEADVSDRHACGGLVGATVDRFGGLDVLCNNAGIGAFGPFADAEEGKIDAVLGVNVKGTLLMSQAAYPHLKASKGCIVNTSSCSGTGGDYQMVICTASKGAVTQITRSLALEWGPVGIRVNAVNPSLTRSEMTGDMLDNDAMIDAFMDRFAIKRIGEPADVAAAVAFLASDDAAFITGANLPVDGGITASNGQPDFRNVQ